MAEINDLDVTDGSNTARFPENQLPSTVNNGARALEGMIARGFKDALEGNKDSTGSSNAYAVAANRTIAAYYDGMRIGFHANHANTGASTLDVDGVGAKDIKKNHDVALASGDIEQHQYVEVVFSASDDAFQMISPTANAGSSYTDPLTTRGDIVKRGASATERLAIGAANTVLTSDGTDPSYSTVATAMIANNAVDETKLKDALIGDFTEVTVAAGDSILLADASDSGNTKRDTVQGILDLAGGGGAWTFISATTLSNDATYSFTSFDASAYDAYVFMLINVIPVTDGVYLDMLTSSDGGSSYDTGASDYNWVFNSSGVNVSDGGVKGDIDPDDAKISLTGNSSGDANKIGSGTGEHGVGGNIWLFDPASTKNTQLTWDLMYQSTTPESVVQIAKGGAVRDSAADVDAIRLSFSSGNMESGQINVYGVKNA